MARNCLLFLTRTTRSPRFAPLLRFVSASARVPPVIEQIFFSSWEPHLGSPKLLSEGRGSIHLGALVLRRRARTLPPQAETRGSDFHRHINCNPEGTESTELQELLKSRFISSGHWSECERERISTNAGRNRLLALRVSAYGAGSLCRVALTPASIPIPAPTIAPTAIQCAGKCSKTAP